MKKWIIYTALFTFFTTFPFRVDARLNYGLKFRSTPENIGNRISFHLTEGGDLTFHKNFSLSFDFCLNNLSEFGYICHFVGNTDEICLMYFPFGSGDFSYFDLVIKGKERLLRLPLLKTGIKTNEWYKLDLSFFPDADSVELSIGDVSRVAPLKFKTTYSPAVVFGTYKTSVDLPAISIKDVVLEDYNQNTVLHYPLNEYIGTTASDINGNHEIEISNPDWLAKHHYRWQPENMIENITNLFRIQEIIFIYLNPNQIKV